MSTETAAPVQMLNVQIDGKSHQFPKGTRVIEACKQAGKFVPHYCYHPKLSWPGNCRMCLIEMGTPMMTPGSTNVEVTKIGDCVSRICFIDDVQGPRIAQFAYEELGKRRGYLLSRLEGKNFFSVAGLGERYTSALRQAAGFDFRPFAARAWRRAASRTSSRGLSLRTVLAPTKIASTLARTAST